MQKGRRPLLHSFTFNGINSRSYCELFVSGGGTFNAPERDIESIPIPGRNGELTIDNGRYKNVELEYNGWIAKNFKENSRKARSWLCGSLGYCRLEDDYNPDEFRRARFINGLEFRTLPDHVAGVTTIRFDCMPQRWLKSGEEAIEIQNGGVLINPTQFEALPIIEIIDNEMASWELTVSNGQLNRKISFNKEETVAVSKVVIDCEYKFASNGDTVSLNRMTSGPFPVLYGGFDEESKVNTISWIGLSSNAKVIVIPRWWTL